MQESVEHGGDGGSIAEQLAPVFDGPIRGEERADPFVPAHDQLKEVFTGRGRQLAHSQVVDDQQRRSGESRVMTIDYLTNMLGTGGAGMLGLIWNPVWGGWL